MTDPTPALVYARQVEVADYLAANLGTGRLPLRRDPEVVEPWDAGLAEPEWDQGWRLAEHYARDEVYRDV